MCYNFNIFVEWYNSNFLKEVSFYGGYNNGFFVSNLYQNAYYFHTILKDIRAEFFRGKSASLSLKTKFLFVSNYFAKMLVLSPCQVLSSSFVHVLFQAISWVQFDNILRKSLISSETNGSRFMFAKLVLE